jgi:hypothetical protein
MHDACRFAYKSTYFYFLLIVRVERNHYGPSFDYNGYRDYRDGVREHSYTHAGSGRRVMRYDAGSDDEDDYYCSRRSRGGGARDGRGWRDRFRCW